MSGERILLLGITGLDKNKVYSNLEQYQVKSDLQRPMTYYSFEETLLEAVSQAGEMRDYLDAELSYQRRWWLDAWDRIGQKIEDENDEKDIILGLHGVLTRREYGIRSPTTPSKIIEDFEPTIIVTLMDDIYLHRARTWKRASNQRWMGKPTLSQLLQARDAEVFLGDLIANQSNAYNDISQNDNPSAPHYILPIWHPARVLHRILFSREKTSLVYMAFPISNPRRKLWGEGESKLKETINDIFSRVSKFEKEHGNLACFCPLSIDELPLLTGPIREKEPFSCGTGFRDEKTQCLRFNFDYRWDVSSFWKDEILLNPCKDLKKKDSLDIPLGEIEEAGGFIRSAIRHRDYRFVEQSDRLGVFNPVMGGSLSTGVRNEVRYAQMENKPSYVYQDPTMENSSKFEKTFLDFSSSMGESPGSGLITMYDKLEDQLEDLAG